MSNNTNTIGLNVRLVHGNWYCPGPRLGPRLVHKLNIVFISLLQGRQMMGWGALGAVAPPPKNPGRKPRFIRDIFAKIFFVRYPPTDGGTLR